MAVRNVIYRTDAGKSYLIALEDWDSRGNVRGALLFGTTPANSPPLPVKIKMRYVNAYLISNPKIKRRFYMGNVSASKGSALGETLQGYQLPPAPNMGSPLLSWRISSRRGELIRL